MRKRGSASVLAMIFLVVFGALSCAFYVMINTSMQVGRNDRNSIRARSAAESGMEVVKHHLALIKLSGKTPDSQVIPTLAAKLQEMLGSSLDRVDPTAMFASSDGVNLEYPKLKLCADGTITKMPRTFGAVLHSIPDSNGLRIVAAVDGFDQQSKLSRSMAAVFYARPAGRSIFEFDMAAAGGITVVNGTIAGSGVNGRANVMSASEAMPSIHIENSQITGGLAVVISEGQVEAEARGKIEVSGFSDVGDIINAVNITDPPIIADFEPTKYLTLMPLTPIAPGSISNGATLTNCIIGPSANSNIVTKIQGGATLNGIIYVKSPNKLQFGGNVTLNGVIIFEEPQDNSQPNDSITFTGSLDQDASAAAPYVSTEVLKAISGVTIMAPAADVYMTGSGSMLAEGSIICDTFLGDNSGFSLNVNNGTILTLSESPDSMMLKNGTITFSRTEAIPPTTGVIFYRQYVMDPKTYEEIFR